MTSPNPPRWITRFFRWFCNPEISDAIEGDLYEQFRYNVKYKGLRQAQFLYFWNVLLFFQPFAIRRNSEKSSKLIIIDMYRNYFKIAIRNLIRHKGISFVKIFGLAVGMGCTLLILLFVENQLSYDKDHQHRDRIVRLESESWVIMPPYLGETVKVFPEVENVVRFYFWYEPTLRYEENVFTIENFGVVDSTIFKVFDFDFLAGSAETAFYAPNSIVLTKSIAYRLFGSENPIGKTVLMGGQDRFTVTAVIDDVRKFHMDINGLVSTEDIARVMGSRDILTSRNFNWSIYLLLQPLVDKEGLIAKINERAVEVDQYGGVPLILRDFNDIYFARNLAHEKNTKHGNINLVIAFAAIGVLILLIACINFINLTIAKTRTREKEIAVRKVTGAGAPSIRNQFFGETLIVVIISFALSILMAYLFMPTFNYLVSEQLQLQNISIEMLLVFVGVLLFTVFVSGIYPSIYLSRVSALSILKGRFGKSGKTAVLSRLLISFQYAISIFLIIATITVNRQLSYMQNKDLGFSNEQILTCRMKGDKFASGRDNMIASKAAFTQRLTQNPNVKGVTFLNQLPGKITNTASFGLTEEDQAVPFRVINADPSFLDLMDIELLYGRNFSDEIQSDMDTKLIVNEEVVEVMGLENPIGTILIQGSNRMEIIGVVKNFHFNSLHQRIEPSAIVWDWWTTRACIKLSGSNLNQTIVNIDEIYREFSPGVGFEYDFLYESFGRQYEAEKRLEKIVLSFVILAILLSCLGLFALTAFVAEQKTKEIGIRKALGAPTTAILWLLSNNFIKWVLVANVVAWPIAFILLRNWLESFSYRIDLGIWVFVGSGVLALLISFFTMSFQGVKSALLNPVDSLKYE